MKTFDEAFSYDPETGIFLWKINRPGRQKAGAVAGSLMKTGYWRLSLNGVEYYDHHMAWWFVHGWMPDYLDHENGNRADNRITNLRLSDATTNPMNAAIGKRNTSGYKGVSAWSYGGYRASIAVNKKDIYLGTYGCPTTAAFAYDNAARIHHGEFARLNFPE